MDLSRYTNFIHSPSGTSSVFDHKLNRFLSPEEIQDIEKEYAKTVTKKQKHTIEEVLKILRTEANKKKDKSSEFLHGRTSGKMEAYSHAYFLVKKLLSNN